MYRDWTYVEDITDGVVAALDRPLGYEIFNIGRGEPVLLAEFVSLLERLAGGKANTIEKPKLAADVTRTYADVGKARRMLGYQPKVSVEEGVTAFWEWFKNSELP
jgi:UDP-glucuronate 4-epimerase